MITILTATYNRAYILPDLYKSLMRQTVKRFQWLIIDDGSVDNTEKMVSSWRSEDGGFPIFYHRKENGGKHRAINFAMQYIDTEYTFLADSDDTLLPQAIEMVEGWLSTIKDDPTFAGVSGLRGYDETHIMGSYPKKVKKGGYIDATNLQRRKYKLDGDKAEVYRTEILKKYPFPEFEGETFVTEAVVWNRIASDGYKLRWFNEIIYIGDYRPDGLTRGLVQLQKDNIEGYLAGVRSEWEIPGFYRYRVLGRCLLFANKNKIPLETVFDRLGGITSYQFLLGNCVAKLQRVWDYCRNWIRK